MAKEKTEAQKIEERRDEALRRALSTPPKHHDDMKLGNKAKQKPSVSASSKKT